MRQYRREISLILRVVILLTSFYFGQRHHVPCGDFRPTQKLFFTFYSSPETLNQFILQKLKNRGALRVEYTERKGSKSSDLTFEYSRDSK